MYKELKKNEKGFIPIDKYYLTIDTKKTIWICLLLFNVNMQ